MLPSIDTYVQNMRDAIRSRLELFFPHDKEIRKKRALYIAQSVAFGLKDYPCSQVNNVIPTLYGILIVANSLDTTGVVIDNKEFITEIQKELDRKPD